MRRGPVAFLSTPSAGRATNWADGKFPEIYNFYPRPPRGGRRCAKAHRADGKRISIHALRGEGDEAQSYQGSNDKVFLSTPSAGRATLMMYGLQPTAANFYPRPPRGGRRAILTAGKRYRKISIHALRKEGDAAHGVNPRKMLISIHALRKEGDEPVFCRYRRRQGFLSTPSARRATRQSHYGHCQHEISIHALRKEGDPAGVNPTRKGEHFYPRPPQGGRPNGFYSLNGRYRISIHALRKEGDNSPAGGKVAI